jgi:acyl-CoA thioester hydrolase
MVDEGRRGNLMNVTSYRVIYGDTDQMGVVYYANYLRWFERGRSELMRQLGRPYKSIEKQGFHFPVTEVSCRYLSSARYDDLILIQTQLTAIKRASLSFSYTILKQSDRSPLAVGSTKHACIGADGRITRIPSALAQHFSKVSLAVQSQKPPKAV